MITRSLIAAVLAFTSMGCGVYLQLGTPPRLGSGVVIKQDRPVDEFDNVEAGGAIEITVTLDDKTSAEIEFDDNLLDIVSLESRGDTLVIRTRENYKSKHGLKVRLSTPRLGGVQLSGASSAHVHGVRDDEFAIQLSGASSVTADGATQNLMVEASGASKIHCRELQAKNVTATLSGASSADVHVSESLTVEASGASDIRFKGQPKQIHRQISGASAVQPVSD